MRSDRLVATLLLLQARGRVTAAEVARELEVSLKTARRDLEALSAAGIPVYAQVGRGGGWSLVGGARTDLTGLTAAETRALFLIAGPSARVAPEARSALRKLVQALPAAFRTEAEAAASAVVIDPARWGESPPVSPPHLATLQQAVVAGAQVRISYAGRSRARSTRTVHPLGLVEKRGAWYLVANTDAGMRTFRVSRILAATLTAEPVERPAGFDLSASWESTVAGVEEERSTAWAIVRVPSVAMPWLRSTFGRAMTVRNDAEGGRTEAEVRGPSAEHIAQLLAGWGGDAEVLEPAEVRLHLARIGSELVARNAIAPRGRR